MYNNSNYISRARERDMGCCSCFEFIRKSKSTSKPVSGAHSRFSQEFLLDSNIDEDRIFHNGEANNSRGEHEELRSCYNRSEKILTFRAQNGIICREHPVKETRNLICSVVIRGFLILLDQKFGIYMPLLFFLFLCLIP